MSLDVYVMPMWRFKAGDVETATERLLGRPTKRLTPEGIFTRKRVQGYFARRRAKREVRRVVAEAEEKLHLRIQWHDEGEVVHAEQASWGFEALRAYAKWLYLKDIFPAFDEPPEANFYKHPVMAFKDESRDFRFSHISIISRF